MKKLILFLFISIFSFGQNDILLKLKDIKCYNSIIDIKSNDSITKKLNSIVLKLNENLFFVSIKKNKKYQTFILLKKSEVENLKQEDFIYLNSEVYIYNFKSKILISISYDNSRHSILEKKNNSYYLGFHPIYDDIDSVVTFDANLKPEFSIKYTGGSIVVLNKPKKTVPLCSYNYRLGTYHAFDIQKDNLYDEYKNIDIGNLYKIVSSNLYEKDIDNKFGFFTFRCGLLEK
jgi:hypothetical protein